MATWTQNIDGAAVVDGALFSVDVGFNALAVNIDNYTPYYIYFKDAESYIAPYWVGAIRTLAHANNYAYCSVASPFGPQAPTTPSYFIHLVWTDNPEVQQTPGSSISSATSGPINITGISFIDLPDTSVYIVPTVAPAIPLPLIPLTNRKALMIQAAESNTDYIYIGGPNVTTSRLPGNFGGISLAAQQTYPIDTATGIPYAIANIPGQIVIVQEGA